jgi:sugar O-acyltransferase (sialic acid O-acetyltransferase NeuD family)
MTSATELIVMGAGGHGRVVADIATDLGYRKISFVDAQWPKLTKNLVWPVVGSEFTMANSSCDVFIALGNCADRLAMVRSLIVNAQRLATLKHPSAQVSAHATIGCGTVVMPLAAVNAGAKLGNGVIANTSCSIDHDCNVSDGVHISPGAVLAGGVSVGEQSWIGAGSVIKENVRIGRDCIVAAGSVVISDVEDGSRVAGVPARPMSNK